MSNGFRRNSKWGKTKRIEPEPIAQQPTKESEPAVFYKALIKDWEVQYNFNINSLRAEFNSTNTESLITLFGKLISPNSPMDQKVIEINFREDVSDDLFNFNYNLKNKEAGRIDIMGGSISKLKGHDIYYVSYRLPPSLFVSLHGVSSRDYFP